MEGCQAASGAGEQGETERGGREGKGRGTGECVCCGLCWASCMFNEVCVFVCCSSVRTRVLVTMYAFACMSMRMSTHS